MNKITTLVPSMAIGREALHKRTQITNMVNRINEFTAFEPSVAKAIDALLKIIKTYDTHNLRDNLKWHGQWQKQNTHF